MSKSIRPPLLSLLAFHCVLTTTDVALQAAEKDKDKIEHTQPKENPSSDINVYLDKQKKEKLAFYEKHIKPFETAANLAVKDNVSNFFINNQSYDAKYVIEFINKMKSSSIPNDEFMVEVLKESSKTGQVGKCFGKSFSNASDCHDVMQRIRFSREIYGQLLVGEKEIEKQFKQWGLSFNFTHKGQEYDLRLDMPPEKQWKYSNLLNEEITSEIDPVTKKHLRQKAATYPNQSIALSKIYQLMEASGNPSIRQVGEDKTLVGLVAQKNIHFTPDVFGRSGTLYLKRNAGFEAELAHAFRNNNNSFGESAQFIRDGLTDILTLNSLGFTPKAQSKNYSDKDKMEYDAHEIVEPAIKRFLSGKIPTIEQMYANIDAERKKQGISYAQTSESEKRTKKGYQEKVTLLAAHQNQQRNL